MMRFFSRVATAMVAVGCAWPAAADLIVDDFSDPGTPSPFPLLIPGGSQYNEQTSLAGTLAGHRLIYFSVDSGIAFPDGDEQQTVSYHDDAPDEFLRVTATENLGPRLFLLYINVDATGAAVPLDLSAYSGISVRLASSNDLTLRIGVNEADAAGDPSATSVATVGISGGAWSPQEYFVPFSSLEPFDPPTGDPLPESDLQSIEVISVDLIWSSGGTAADIYEIRIVPEPSSLMLFVGLGTAFWTRRRRRSAAAPASA